MSEIFVIAAIVLAIFVLPRLVGKQTEKDGTASTAVLRISGWLRLAIMASILWPAGAAFFLKPWSNQWSIFLCVGIGPVMLFWGVYWVVSGFKK